MGQKETKVLGVSRKRAYNFNDLSGKKFNHLLVLKLDSIKNNTTYWLCQCDCGNIKKISAGHLKNGHTKSCGCIRKDCRADKNPSYKHGLRKSRLYEILVNIKTRCYNVNNKTYKNYGGRGITVCEEWRNDFLNFYNWAMDNGYRDDLTIDRIDVNGNYEPSNCRWVNWKIQQNNRRNNHIIEYNGEKHTLQEWSEILPINVSSSVLRYRILNGWSIEDAFLKNVRRIKK